MAVYTVSKANLGANASLLAASALMIDYVPNVAVGISGGVGALTSRRSGTSPLYARAMPCDSRAGDDHERHRCRPRQALPTYLFVASLVLILAIGAITFSALKPRNVKQPSKWSCSNWGEDRYRSKCEELGKLEEAATGDLEEAHPHR
jgi:hypothetical protein